MGGRGIREPDSRQKQTPKHGVCQSPAYANHLLQTLQEFISKNISNIEYLGWVKELCDFKNLSKLFIEDIMLGNMVDIKDRRSQDIEESPEPKRDTELWD